MATTDKYPIEGGCDCKTIRYRMETKPLFVHCCHCMWCQRESGASFALNAMIEGDRITNLGKEPELVHTPSESSPRTTHCAVPQLQGPLFWSKLCGRWPNH